MATTTTNFGWDIPQSTDLVKDGATAIAALGQDIDTALVDLKGGTTGQVLAKATNTDLDYSWTTPAGASGMTLITNQTVTSSTTVNVNNVFSATYDNYFIVSTLTSAASQSGDVRVRVGGADNTTASSYIYERMYADGSSLTASKTTSDKWTGIIFAAPDITFGRMYFYRPFIAAQTGMDSNSSAEGNYLLSTGGLHNQSTSYTGFTLLFGTAVTGEIKVYGLAE
jgi:hypothetical protein